MKFMIITNHSYMLWQFRRELIAEMLKHGEVVLSMPFVGHEDDFKAMGCKCIDTKVDRRGINPKTDIKLYFTYKNLLKAEKPDMVVTYSIKPNVYAGYACRRLGIPYCVNVQGLGTAFEKKGLAQVATVMYKLALKKARTVFFENEGNAEVFRNKKITKKNQVCVLPGAGINLEHYKYQDYPENNPVHFLYLGRIMKEKGMDELFTAVENLSEKYDFVLDLVGFFEDQYKDRVDKLVQKRIVVFHGFQEEPRPFYAKADCVVLPSYHEGMSNVLLEAAATGRALITSDIPGCREAVDEGKNGFLCECMNSKSLEECMERFLLISNEERRNMGIYGRAKMEKEFDKNYVVNKTFSMITGRKTVSLR